MSESEVLIRVESGVGRITLNRPKALHALNRAMCETMTEALLAWRTDEAVKSVLIDHAGERGFCAGGDIRMIAESGAGDASEAKAFFKVEYRLNHLMFEYPKPITAIVDGIVMGGGVGISEPADVRIATERTTYAMPETGIGLFLVERGAEGLAVRGYPTQDGARAAELAFSATPAAMISADGAEALTLASDIGIAAACAEAVGLMDRLVAITVDYMNTRKQFGVTIAGFQALRHRIADVKMQLELARSMSYYATLKLGEPAPQRRRALSQAKVQLGQSMRFVGQQCVQLHGGIGVTDEYVASHYFKRLTMLEMAFGDTLHHLGEVSDRMQDTAGVFA